MRPSRIDHKLTKTLRDLFDTNEVYASRKDSTVTVEFENRDTSFADLQMLSEFFGTKNINMGSEVRNGGVCETCSFTYTVNIVTVSDITKGI